MAKNKFRKCESMMMRVPDTNNYTVGVYWPGFERCTKSDVTQLIREEPDTTILDLVKYAGRMMPVSKFERKYVGPSMELIRRWEQKTTDPECRISFYARDKDGNSRQFYKCIGSHTYCSSDDLDSVLCPKSKAKPFFEEKSKKKYELNLHISLYVVGML